MGDDPKAPDALFDFMPAGPANDEDATTIAQLRATSEGLRRLNEMLLLFEETDAETRATEPPTSEAC